MAQAADEDVPQPPSREFVQQASKLTEESAEAGRLPQEVEQRFAKIREAWKTLGEDEKLEEFEELHNRMERHRLPGKARLFILDNGAHSIAKLNQLSERLIFKAKAGIQQDFSVLCIEEFLTACQNDDYDYISDGHTPSATKSLPAVPIDSRNSSLPSSSSNPQPHDSSAFSDGYPSTEPDSRSLAMHKWQLPAKGQQVLAPTPRPRRVSQDNFGNGECGCGGSSTVPKSPIKPNKKEKSSVLKRLLFPEVRSSGSSGTNGSQRHKKGSS